MDTETFGKFTKANVSSPYVTDDHTLYQPPVKTIAWYHTGAFINREKILSQFSDEYFPNWFEASKPDEENVSEEFREIRLPEPDLDGENLTAEEWREALRACKGMMLRQEVYELDVDALAVDDPLLRKEIPVKLFTTAYHNCHIKYLQPKEKNRYAVFHVTESEAITFHYELDLKQHDLKSDPRITHTLNLNIDEYGNILQSVAVVYPRIGTQTDSLLSSDELELINRVQKDEKHLFYSENFYTDKDISDDDNHRLRLICEANTYELTGINPETNADIKTEDPWVNFYFSIDELRSYRLNNIYQNNGKGVGMILYHEIPRNTNPTKRLVEQVRTLYFNESLDGPEDFKTLNRRGIVYETYKLALTESLLSAVFKDKLAREIHSRLSDPEISGYVSGNDLIKKFGNETVGQYWIPSGIAGFENDAIDHFCLPERYTDPFKNTTTLKFDDYDLYIKSSTDPLDNTVSVELFDYRILQPCKMKDINNNLSEVLFDALGMPIAMALRGKGNDGDNLECFNETYIHPDLNSIINFFTWNCEDDDTKTEEYLNEDARKFLGNATARYIYYLGEKKNGDTISWENHPACACDIVREKHVASLIEGEQSPIQVAFEYSDCMGTVLVKKIQAEPEFEGGPLRWIASGKTILNNKGKPVKQYEPYFCENHCFEEPENIGVATIMYYDAPGRLVRTEMPDRSYSRVEFSPWFVANYDQNDTLLEPGNGWYNKYIATLTMDEESKIFAECTTVHANTPQLTYLDSLGREVISIEHNRHYKNRNVNDEIIEEKYLTFKKLDAEGKPLWICDARKNLVMQYIWPVMPDFYMHDPHYPENQFDKNKNGYAPCYDIAGNLLFQHSMDAGDRWILNDAAGKPMFAWDFNQRQDTSNTFIDENRLYSTIYDELHRPVKQRLRINEENEQLIEQFIYGEKLNNAVQLNLHGQLYQHYDQSGLITHHSYDFKGNLLKVQKQLTSEYKAPVIDWQENSPTAELEEETFAQITEYDALNRISRLFNWHQETVGRVAVYEPHYNQRGLLESEDLVVKANKTDSDTGYTIEDIRNVTTPISGITYDAKGQREKVKYGNGTITRYQYDPETYRLVKLQTTRTNSAIEFPEMNNLLRDNNILQNLSYTYDPVGNITEINDDAFKPTFYNNQKVKPESKYVYDALYRLIEASGRENRNNTAPRQFDPPPIGLTVNSDAIMGYGEYYSYDPVGNIIKMRHSAKGGSWTRRYEYYESNNRLKRTWEGSDNWEDTNAENKITYQYDSHGNMLNLTDTDPKYYMHWDYRDMISSIDLGGGGFVFYNYDSEKQRTRKVIEDLKGNKQSERIYLGGVEIYKRYDIIEEIESIHLMDGDHQFLLVEDVLESKSDEIDKGILYRYQYSNHLGSAVLELNKNAIIISYEEYHPYGTTAFHAKNAGIKAAAKRYRYTGKERDEESGLYYHGARYYAPWLGGWISCDPKGIQTGIGLYTFVSNNPINRLDFTGEQDVSFQRRARKMEQRAFRLGGHIISVGNWLVRKANLENTPVDTAIQYATAAEAAGLHTILTFGSSAAAGIVKQFVKGGTDIGTGLGRAVTAKSSGDVAIGLSEAAGGFGIAILGDLPQMAHEAGEGAAKAVTARNAEERTLAVAQTVAAVSGLAGAGLGVRAVRAGKAGKASTVPKSQDASEFVYRRMSFEEAKISLTEGLQLSTNYGKTWISPNKQYVYNYPTKVGIGNYDVMLEFNLKPGSLKLLEFISEMKIERGAVTMGVPNQALRLLNDELIINTSIYSLQPTMLGIMKPGSQLLGFPHKPFGYEYSIPKSGKY